MSETSGYPENHEAFEADRMRDHLSSLVVKSDDRLAAMRPEIDDLMDVRHKLYKLPRTFFDAARPTLDQMYDDDTYNDVFVYGYDPRANIKQADEDGNELPIGADLAARNGAEFHKGEQYDEGEYAQAILAAANHVGIIRNEIIRTDDPIRHELGVGDSELQPVGRVDATVVPCAAGISNPIRIYNTIDDIAQDRIDTDMIILASCDRPVRDDEREKLEAKDLPAGKTEFESAVLTLNKFAGASLDVSKVEPHPVRLKPGEDGVFTGTVLTGTATIGGREKTVIAINAAYDPARVSGRDKDDDPVYAIRANTDETFVAALPFLPKGPGKVVIESHDAWTAGQGIVGEQIFGVAGKDVIATGPQKLDRVTEKTADDGTVSRILLQPGAVVDEIAKTYAFLTQLRIKASNALKD